MINATDGDEDTRTWSLSWSDDEEAEFAAEFERVLHSCSFQALHMRSTGKSISTLEEFVVRLEQVSLRAEGHAITLNDAARVSIEMAQETGHRLSVHEVAAGISILSFLVDGEGEQRLSVAEVTLNLITLHCANAKLVHVANI